MTNMTAGEMSADLREVGQLVLGALRNVAKGMGLWTLVGDHHHAGEFGFEEQFAGDERFAYLQETPAYDATWFLAVDGALYLETEHGRIYHSRLDEETMRDAQNPIGRVLGELLIERGIDDPQDLIARISVEDARNAAEELLVKEATDTDDFRLAGHGLVFTVGRALDLTEKEETRLYDAYFFGRYRA